MSSRPTTASSSVPVGGDAALSSPSGLSSGQDELDHLEDESAEQPFLWEQISDSIDPVELEEIRRFIGDRLVSACTDVYAEVRALREILHDYSADTDELLKKRASVPRSLGSQPAGLVQMELKSPPMRPKHVDVTQTAL